MRRLMLLTVLVLLVRCPSINRDAHAQPPVVEGNEVTTAGSSASVLAPETTPLPKSCMERAQEAAEACVARAKNPIDQERCAYGLVVDDFICSCLFSTRSECQDPCQYQQVICMLEAQYTWKVCLLTGNIGHLCFPIFLNEISRCEDQYWACKNPNRPIIPRRVAPLT